MILILLKEINLTIRSFWISTNMKLTLCASIEYLHLICEKSPFDLSIDDFEIGRWFNNLEGIGMVRSIIVCNIVLMKGMFKMLQIYLCRCLYRMLKKGIISILFITGNIMQAMMIWIYICLSYLFILVILLFFHLWIVL